MNNKEQKRKIIQLSILLASIVGMIVTYAIMEFAPFGVSKLRSADGVGLLDSKLFYNATVVNEYMASLFPESFGLLRTIYALDSVFAVFSVICGVTIIVSFLSYSYNVAFVLPLVVLQFLFDMTENALIALVVKKYPEHKQLTASMCGGATLCKWIFTILTIIAIAVLGITILVKKNRSKLDNKQVKDEPVDADNS